MKKKIYDLNNSKYVCLDNNNLTFVFNSVNEVISSEEIKLGNYEKKLCLSIIEYFWKNCVEQDIMQEKILLTNGDFLQFSMFFNKKNNKYSMKFKYKDMKNKKDFAIKLDKDRSRDLYKCINNIKIA